MTSFIFPGQGSQYLGMCKDFYDNFKSSKKIVEEIEDITSLKIKKILFEDSDKLNLTKYTQICIFTASIIIFKSINEEVDIQKLNIKTMLGHSLGEYTALAASKKLSIEDAAKLLKFRGQLMHDAIKPNLSGMAALIGLNAKKIDEIINNENLNVYIANDNSPKQIVISGMIDDITNSKDFFLNNEVKRFIPLNVSAAFHCNIMLDAQKKLKDFIDRTTFHNTDVSIISNFSGKISNETSNIKWSLVNQMANKVRWTESIDSLGKINDFDIIEVGPGKILSGLIKKINDNFSIKSINSVEDLKLFKNGFVDE